jgi:integrase
MAHSTRRKADDKAAVLAAARKHKAEDKVPLLSHATMRWGRKINGRLHYFRKVDPALPDFGQAAAGLTTHVDTVAREFPKLMLKAGLNGNRAFYALRHTFQTVAQQCGDFPAIGHIMGHHDGSMAGRYRERIGDDRLRKVVDYVHAWLFDDKATE